MLSAADFLKLCEDELYCIGQDSWSRPHTALDIARQICNARPDVAWQFIMNAWSGFDLIPHDDYRRLFARKAMREWWCPGWMPADAKQFYETLPAKVTIYRGQDGDHGVGLSWTTDIAIATRFARGHRGSVNPDPVVMKCEVRKRAIVFVTVDREESETVLWKPPTDVAVIRPAEIAADEA
jgi:hypothetical protein